MIYPARTFRAVTGAHGWVAGLYDGKIRVPAAGLHEASPAAVRSVLTHEYAHALVHAVAGPRAPIWLQEGFAQLAEGRPRHAARRSLTRGTAPSLKSLTAAFSEVPDPTAVARRYDAALDLVHFLVDRGGLPTLADLFDRLGKGEALDAALLRLYGQQLEPLVAEWRASLPE